MKSRRNFLQASFCGLLCGMVISLPKWSFADKLKKNGIVKQPDEGETYFVRENTPITIKVSKKVNEVDSVSICTEEILPGKGISVHKHLNEDEIFFFHTGKGTFIMDEEEIEVNAGSTAFVPRGTWHGFKNTGSESIIFAFSYTPSGFEDFFREVGTIKGVTFKVKTPEQIKLLAVKYGIVYK